MDQTVRARVEAAKQAALEVLQHNACGPFDCLPRTAGWGYPEPYTRDIMISSLGILVSGDASLIAALRRMLEALAAIQTPLGHIPSLAHTVTELGASDTTPLFLMALALFRKATRERDFLETAMQRALTWMENQSPGDEVIVGQLPTSDWRDEQWVLGFGLFVNAVVYTYLRLLHLNDRARRLRRQMRKQFAIRQGAHEYIHERFISRHRPYYALWRYKIYGSERFDLLGNSIAILSGMLSLPRAKALICWVEDECAAMRERRELTVDLPPNLFPYILPDDPDWLPRYEQFNQPGEYHNGGVWPFICGFYVAAIVATGNLALAERKLVALTDLVHPAQNPALAYGFNEWISAQDGVVRGQDWQTWSAAMYLYAAACVEQGHAIFFEEIHERRKAA